MAEEGDRTSSNKSSPYNSESEENNTEKPKRHTRPDLGIDDIKYNPSSQNDSGLGDCSSSSAKPSSSTKKEESPFSFRHFLKRDLSLPGSSTYENGVRPKTFANTVQHSPIQKRTDEPRNAILDQPTSRQDCCSSEELNPNYYRPNLAQESLGMPSLPDFVQDHLLVEQVYLNNEGPLSLDLDNLPDFTINNEPSSSRNMYNEYGYLNNNAQEANESLENQSSPSPNPLDLPHHLNLDLTESVNTVDRRNNSPHNSFPLDLPANAAGSNQGEIMRLPDFLPLQAGRQSPESAEADREIARLSSEVDSLRSELISERNRNHRLQSELNSALEMQEALREELRISRQNSAAGSSLSYKESHIEPNECIKQLKKQVLQLQDQLEAAVNEANSLRAEQFETVENVRLTTEEAENKLRELLLSLQRLKSSRNLDSENT